MVGLYVPSVVPNPRPALEATDAETMGPGRMRPPRLSRAQANYERALRGLGRHVGAIIRDVGKGSSSWLEALPTLRQMLEAYAQALMPWAHTVAGRMLNEVNKRDLDSWRSLGRLISHQLHRDIERTPIGETLRKRMAEQVHLIRSIPIVAAQRVHDITIESLSDSTRYQAHVREIMRSGEVAQSHATLIARTETARTASILTEARATIGAGSTHYVWRTAGDADVRKGHKAMEGKVCEWANPPAVNEGGRIMYHHPGAIWNCRCNPEPILDDKYLNKFGR